MEAAVDVFAPRSRGGRGVVGKLRKGMMIQVGPDARDRDAFITGPADVPLNPRMAIANITKFENVGEIKAWLARDHADLQDGFTEEVDGKQVRRGPISGSHFRVSAPRLSPEQRFDKAIEDMKRINQGKGVMAPDAPASPGPSAAGLVSQQEFGQLVNTVHEMATGLKGLVDALAANAKAAEGEPKKRGNRTDK